MINEELRKEIAETNEDALLFDNPSFDNSIVGISQDDRVIYYLGKMCEEYAKENKCSYEEALEFIEENTLRTIPYGGEYAPIGLMDGGLFEEGCLKEK